jgi:hypothetical protein
VAAIGVKVGEDHFKSCRDLRGVDHQHHDGGDDVGHAHKRHQGRRHFTDTLDTTEDHHAYKQHGDQTGQPQRHIEGGLQGGGHAVDLDHVADTETGKTAEDGEGGAQPQPLLAQTVLDCVHRPADVLAAVILLAVMHRQHHFAVLGSHTHQCGTPHPEQRTRPAEEDRGGHTGDIAGTDCSGQAGHQRLERADLTAFGIAFLAALPHQFEACADLSQRHELQAQHEE